MKKRTRPKLKPGPNPGAASRDAHQQLSNAVRLHGQGQLEQAATIYREVLRATPGHFDALHLLGVVHAQRKESGQALELFDRAARLNPHHAALLVNRGGALRDLKRSSEALESYDRALALVPNLPEALNNRGNALRDLKRPAEALDSFERAIAAKRDYADAFYNRGNAQRDLGQNTAAVYSYERALALKPRHLEALNNRGNALRDLKRPAEALENYEQALSLAPRHADVLNNHGNALRDLGRHAEALSSYERALSADPDYRDALNNRAATLRELRRPLAALASVERALELEPNWPAALNNLGNALADLRRTEAAVVAYERALALRPDDADTLNNRGSALLDLRLLEAALASYNAALALDPNHCNAWSNRGNALVELGRFAEAEKSYEQALALNPDHDYLLGSWLAQKLKICDWRELDEHCQTLREKIAAGKPVSQPFPVLALSNSAAEQRRAAEIYVAKACPAELLLPGLAPYYDHERLRIGYFSADLQQHATAYLMAELFELHDRERFECFAFSFGAAPRDAMRLRLEAAFEHFSDVRQRSDQEVAELARSLEIDIAVDLKGFTRDSRPNIFALRAAPLQVSYLGYPGSMGARYIDYLIADPLLIPVEARSHYLEKIAYLPHCYQVNDSKRSIGAAGTRAAHDLPSSAFVFCCFNNSYKITPTFFDIWMRLLARVPGSVLWLLDDNPSASEQLRGAAGARGIAPERLIFAQRTSLPEHLARQSLADLFLDTLPYNAHTTASDALWAGLPLLSCQGETFAGRVASSLLTAVGLEELITRSLAEYETRALHLATHPEILAQHRQSLAKNRLTRPLFDTPRFTRDLEALYSSMQARQTAGLPPEHLEPRAPVRR